jgi:uncharacterized cupredoxin-like copper-binding protein
VRTQAAAPHKAHKARRLAILPAVISILALAGCGSSSSSSSSTTAPEAPAGSTPSTGTSSPTPSSTAPSSGGSPLSLAANPGGALEYDKKSLSAKAGKVQLDFTNSSPIPHNVTIESSSGATVGATPTFQGGSKTLSLNLKPGTYKFFCSVPGHRQAGMEGTLTVE